MEKSSPTQSRNCVCWLSAGASHYNTIRPLSLGYRSPAPEAWLTNNTGHGEVTTAMRFPLPHTPTTATMKSKQLRYTNSSNGTKIGALHCCQLINRRRQASWAR